ncbi:MAG: hypothetical protein JHC26_06745 [Thermofilum sp.]|jgi:hypothetical protein|uniref:hypothetical protein n=1 Tax=Thermofilum sp. TaxID=1961369 RepID=UPI0025877351|nr:hypothetical protein [Thermofilum sp.]MCI4408772.1 hypothetical protein [Thermofilum sp.]
MTTPDELALKEILIEILQDLETLGIVELDNEVVDVKPSGLFFLSMLALHSAYLMFVSKNKKTIEELIENVKDPKNVEELARLTTTSLLYEITLLRMARKLPNPTLFNDMYIDVLFKFIQNVYRNSTELTRMTRESILKLYEDMKRDGVL